MFQLIIAVGALNDTTLLLASYHWCTLIVDQALGTLIVLTVEASIRMSTLHIVTLYSLALYQLFIHHNTFNRVESHACESEFTVSSNMANDQATLHGN